VEEDAVRAVFLPRSGAGAAQVRSARLEHSVRVQRERSQDQHASDAGEMTSPMTSLRFIYSDYILTCLGQQALYDANRDGDKHTNGDTNRKNLAPCGTDGRLLLSGFQLLVTLTLTLDRVIRHTVMHHSSTSIYIPNFIQIGKTSCGRTDRRDRAKFKVT